MKNHVTFLLKPFLLPFITLGFLCYCSQVKAQDSDSTFKPVSLADTIRAIQYFQQGEQCVNQRKTDSAIYHYTRAADLFQQIGTQEPDTSVWAYYVLCHNRLGRETARLKGDSDSALVYLFQGLETGLPHVGPKHPQIALAYNIIGVMHWQKEDKEKAKEYYERALDIWHNVYGLQHAYTGKALSNLTAYYAQNGQFYKALAHNRKAITSFENGLGPYNGMTRGVYSSRAGIFNWLGKKDSALYWYSKSMAIHPEISPYEYRYVVNGLQYSAFIHKDRGATDAAIQSHKRSSELWTKTFGPTSSMIPNNLLNIGNLYRQQGENEKAREAYNMALKSSQELYGEKHKHTGKAYQHLAYLEVRLRNFYQALVYYQSAMKALDWEFEEDGLEKNSDLKTVNDTYTMLRVLWGKALSLTNLYYEDTTQTETLLLAFETHLVAEKLADQIRKEAVSLHSRQRFQELLFDAYQYAILTANELFNLNGEQKFLEAAFRLSEKNKSMALSDAIRNSQAMGIQGLPEEMKLAESGLREQLVKGKNNLLRERSQKSPSEENIKDLQAQVLRLQFSYDSLIRKLDNDFPTYYQFKYNDQPSGLPAVQAYLKQKEAVLLEFFQGEDHTWLFVITPDSSWISAHIGDSDKLNENLSSFLSHVSNSQFSLDSVVNESESLFHTLLGPVYASIRDVENWIIIPDGRLNYLPFEALIPGPAYSADQPTSYLVTHHTIRYEFSTSLLLNQNLIQSSREMLATFAPVYQPQEEPDLLTQRSLYDIGDEVDDLFAMQEPSYLIQRDSLRSGFGPLPYAQEEASQIMRLVKGDMFQADAASERQFKSGAGSYNILHLSMHAFTDPDDPLMSGLVFSTQPRDSSEDGVLHAYELYDMKLNASLAVLSACETGVGQYQPGEGVSSLTRAFKYAGCPNIVTSLWKVNDRATSQLMTAFYTFLKAGDKTDQALRKAKLKYLAESPKSASHPFYWASFVLVGESQSITSGQMGLPHLLMGLGSFFALVLAGGMVLRRRRKKNI